MSFEVWITSRLPERPHPAAGGARRCARRATGAIGAAARAPSAAARARLALAADLAREIVQLRRLRVHLRGAVCEVLELAPALVQAAERVRSGRGGARRRRRAWGAHSRLSPRRR
eukprot:CAMPEP_0119418906 /NCGR_PEP_ID=MMETSP1335-20130426/19425_1 /TAXON_ID=259385 /ORGANISM="Chrysoculter rhomboideus, Strain RCC1486" /LENGTH=114 /DNA_ID=CAMNT_0007444179 /DNA_START=34 /DNA_END=374 /DNA_ORIENTATION=-